MTKLIKDRSISAKLTMTPTEQRVTHEGMAHFAGTGPHGRTCRECRHWACWKSDYKNDGQLRDARCDEFPRKAHGKKGKPVPHNALACKYFVFNPEAPKAYRND